MSESESLQEETPGTPPPSKEVLKPLTEWSFMVLARLEKKTHRWDVQIAPTKKGDVLPIGEIERMKKGFRLQWNRMMALYRIDQGMKMRLKLEREASEAERVRAQKVTQDFKEMKENSHVAKV